ncbi:MAG TPA: DUF2604 domain-containing protein, partial [Allosphingosinicella sp.]|nr:DUF2604 domain-containing protein [Allosphingosinicella sp.]
GGGQGGGQSGNPNTITLGVSVNGEQAVQVTANINAPLKTLIPDALHASGNVGRPAEDWQLKDKAGTVLDLEQKIGEFHFVLPVTLFLTLGAGAAGAC